jgi:hypothetical protein
MHADRIGWGVARECAAGYALMAVLFLGIDRLGRKPKGEAG